MIMLSMMRCVTVMLLIDLVCAGRLLWRMKERLHNIQQVRIKQQVMTHPSTAIPKEGRIHQPLNHLDIKNAKTFPQRFFVNDIYWQRSDGPVFLYIEGEGPLSKFSVLYGHHVEMAERQGALLVALEHRFYGESINPDGLETEQLKDLSSQQALADLAVFHRYISQRFGLSYKNIWISFGGSYAGALSAWLRGKFPHLIYGAVASSAPVHAQLDFSSYNKVVGRSLMKKAVGGSKKCLTEVREAFAAVEAALLMGNEIQLAKDFGCCETPIEPQDKTELMQSLADIFMGTVQYNEEGVAFNIEELCHIMTNKSEAYNQKEEAYDRLIKLVEMYRARVDAPCLDVSHEKFVLELNSTTVRSSYRPWLYQTCTEFGFYQTCEDDSCPFSHTINLQSQAELCSQLFNIPQYSLPVYIDFTNQYYGGNRPQTQRVLYVNGNIDPWAELSVTWNDTTVDNDRVILINGTAHCADMNHHKALDKPVLHRARKEIERRVAMWLTMQNGTT
ncbi:thymus-specific serine protease [Triplophysa rosa]|uniref:Thymus-specific serine protease n=1 Tax=Triplophysa rosa TaxID=992332 RepID=A0A9W7TNS5_TRIRA|nr:thymus-specific serine protease [Triplophysa rosa]KAI7800555.1 putative thymus-specific serine protease [Triplophysa rosa]